MMRTVAIGGATLLALALTACGPSSDVTQMESNESSLRELVANDRSQIEELQEKLKQQNDRLAELEHSDDHQDNGTAADQGEPPGVAPAAAATPDMSQASPGATPAAGTEAAAGASPAADSDENSDADATPAAAPTPGPEVAAVTPPLAPAPVSPAPTWQAALNQELAAKQTDPAARLYRSGLAALKAGKFKPALAAFQDLQRRYPKSRLSEPAEYFSANALFELGLHEKSILQFNDLTMRFPEGRFASSALLREAQAFVKINDQIDARLTLQKLLNDHPSAPEASMAKSMMDSLSS